MGVTGLLTPFVVWYVLRHVAKLLTKTPDIHDLAYSADTTPKFTPRAILVLCGVALISCALYSFCSSLLIGWISGATRCIHGWREIHIVTFASGFATALSVVISLLYLYQSAKASERPEPPQSSKLMLVEVPNGGKTATVRNANVF